MSSKRSNPNALGPTDEVKKIFNKFDKNGDGKISCDELKDILSALGSKTSSDEVMHIMSEIDKDGDGFISLNEFSDFHIIETNNNSDKELRDAFDLYDLDKNGVISESELHVVMKKLGEKCTLQDCRKMIKNVDTDGDGYVDFEEFKRMMSGPQNQP